MSSKAVAKGRARGGGRLRKHDPALSFLKCSCQLCKARFFRRSSDEQQSG